MSELHKQKLAEMQVSLSFSFGSEVLIDLQKLLAASKNYSKYREEIDRRIANLLSMDAEARRIAARGWTFPADANGKDKLLSIIEFGNTGIVPHLAAHLSEILVSHGTVNSNEYFSLN